MHLGIILLSWHWKWKVLTLTFKVIRPFRLTKWHSTSLLYTDLGWPRGATRPKCALVKIKQPWDCLVLIMGIPTLVRHHLYIDTVPGKVLPKALKFHYGFRFNLRPVLASKYCCYLATLRLCVHLCQSWALQCHNSLPIQTRITKFGSNMQTPWSRFLLFWRSNWPWHLKPNLTLK